MLPALITLVFACSLHLARAGGHHQAHSFGRRSPLPDLAHHAAPLHPRAAAPVKPNIRACGTGQFRNPNGRCVDCPDDVAACTSATSATACDPGYHLVTRGRNRNQVTSCEKDATGGGNGGGGTTGSSRFDVTVDFLGCYPQDNNVASVEIDPPATLTPQTVVARCYEAVGGGAAYSTYCLVGAGHVYLADDLAGDVAGKDGNCNAACGDGFCGNGVYGQTGSFYSVWKLADGSA